MKLWTKRIFLDVATTLLIFGSSSCSLSTHQTNSNVGHSTNTTYKSSTEIAKKSSTSTGQTQHSSFKRHKKQRIQEGHLPPGTGEEPPGIEKNDH